MAERCFLCFVEVFDDSTGGPDQIIVIVTDTEAFEGGSAEMLLQALLRLIGVKIPTGTFGYNCAGQLGDVSCELFHLRLEQFAARLGEQTLDR